MRETITIQSSGFVRRGDEKEERRRWEWLENELMLGMNADEPEFAPLDVESIIAEAKTREHGLAC